MIAPITAVVAIAVAASGPAFLGPDELSASPCIAAAAAVKVKLGPFILQVPFSDLKRLKATERPEGMLGCDAPLPVEDILISTPSGFRGNLTYRATLISASDAMRVRDTLVRFAQTPTCEPKESVKVCRIRANPMAPVTTFVFARDTTDTLPSGPPIYQRCVDGASGKVCKIQDLDPTGYQYEAAVEDSEDAAVIRGRHALAHAKWMRFLRAGASATP